MFYKRALFFLLFAFSIGCRAAAPATIPTETFFRPPSFGAVKISPNGHYLALVGPVKGDETQTQLVFLDLTTLQVIGHYTVIDNQQISNLWWVTDDKIVYTTVVQKGYLDYPFSTYNLWVVGVDGKNLSELDCGAVRDVLPGPTGKVIYDSCAGGLAVKEYVDGHDHPTRWFGGGVPFDYGSAYMDLDGDIRVAMGLNTRTFAPRMLYRDKGSKLGDWQDIVSLIATEPRFGSYGPLGFVSADGAFYFRGTTPAGTLGLYAVEPHSLTKKLLFDDPDYDIDYEFSDLDLLFSADHEKIVALRYDADRPKWVVLDPAAPQATTLAKLQKAFVGEAIGITSSTNDGRYAVVYAWSDRDPGGYYLYDVRADKLHPLFKRLPAVDPGAMAEMRPIEFKASDGTLIHGYLTLPKGASGKSPLIVYPHGGPFGIRDTWGFDPVTQFLAYHGYAVLQVEYRGSGGFGAKFEEDGFRQWAGRMQDDLVDGVRWAASQGFADENRVCIYGASAGGYAAIEATIHAPNLYKCAVGYSGIYDLTEWRGSVGVMHDSLAIPFMKATVGDDEATMKAESPVYHVDQIKAALFLAHGGDDGVVPVQHADELRDALDKAGKKYEWLYYPKEGHGFWEPEHQVEFYDKVLAFFDKNIGTGRITSGSN